MRRVHGYILEYSGDLSEQTMISVRGRGKIIDSQNDPKKDGRKKRKHPGCRNMIVQREEAGDPMKAGTC